MHHGQPGGDVHGPADAVQQDVRDGPRPEDGRARRSSGLTQSQIRTTPVSRQLFFVNISNYFLCWQSDWIM